MHHRYRLKALPLAALIASLPAWATNGMNMEGYGPVSTGMGGASQAMDHGAAAMAQNPATLALGGPGARLDVAIGVLGPDVSSRLDPFPTAKSGGTSYVMPAFGYVRRSGDLSYGLGLFAQGGMGTEYTGNTFLAAGSGEPVRSELGVGRVLLPLAWNVTPDFAVGATLDFMWAGLDLRLAALASDLGALVTGGSGNLAMGLQQMLPTLPAGTYALYTKPWAEKWEVYFYTDTNNGGLPAQWDEGKVAARITVPVQKMEMPVETFTITIDDLTNNGAAIGLIWSDTYVGVPFGVPTAEKALRSIERVMAGPTANDYFSAASYFQDEGQDLQKAREWIDKAVAQNPDAYWMSRRQSLIYAALGDKKGAIEAAKKSLAAATKAGNADYVKMNEDSLREWGGM